MVSDELMLKVENVSKIYRLGEIGGTTLRDEIQRLNAKIRRKPDPTKKIGVKDYNRGEKFNALDSISFTAKKGERIGIIGHNGAGKSTLLKLISRVTGPTSGNIYLNGRVASMLEVGTGFHPELTGRENIYMNGAILGMTKKEIDSKIKDIIDFSEISQFIDTPVKRYSSGMYVKLAFSVAAHLDSEIMIMDEVLAVGDINFQQKCISKMIEVSNKKSRTILYVSHNMTTIKMFCDRVIVLEKGNIVFDGDVDEGIRRYLQQNTGNIKKSYDLSSLARSIPAKNEINFKEVSVLENANSFAFSLILVAGKPFDAVILRIVVFDSLRRPVGAAFSKKITNIAPGDNKYIISFNTHHLVNGKYSLDLILSTLENDILIRQDVVNEAIGFEVATNVDTNYGMSWIKNSWGCIQFDMLEVNSDDSET